MITLKENLKKLKEISKLKQNWIGYNEPPLDKKIISEVRNIVKLIDKENISQPFVAPFAGGDGIQIEWDLEETYFEIGFRDNSKKCETYICQVDNVGNHLFNLEGTIERDKFSIIAFIKFVCSLQK